MLPDSVDFTTAVAGLGTLAAVWAAYESRNTRKEINNPPPVPYQCCFKWYSDDVSDWDDEQGG